jgi:glyoxylase-like metal-dependent hydrolase (beta-lactamase superfamily II)
LPGGNEPLLPLQWRPVPGCGEALIYPLIRKVDTESSNSYIVQTSDAFIIIDPGGLPDQSARLAAIVRETRAAPVGPLVVILTHAHVDHYMGALSVPLLTDPETAVIAAPEDGVGALESGDRRLTQAEVLGLEVAPLRIDLHLLAVPDGEGGDAPLKHTYANGAAITVMRGPPESGLRHEQLILGSGPPLEVYHTPGHSPDSCCIRIGRLLFTGDLLFGASPGIAGIAGWDQEELIRSLAGVRTLLSHGTIETICPGHGQALSVEDGLRMLGAVEGEARLLTGIAEWNVDRTQQTAAFAEECMEQVSELFTVMTGRLYYVSHVMDELGESDIAVTLHELIRGAVIDDLLDSFDAFNREYHSGRYVPLNLALKGGQVIGKLQRSFNQDALSQIVDASLVQRAERLLTDYTTFLRGFDPPCAIAVHDLRDLLEVVIHSHTVHSCSDEEILASADDDTAFGRLLLARIGMPPLLSDIAVDLDAGAEPLSVLIDRDRFLDLATFLLEDLVGSGVHAIAVRAGRSGEAVAIAISGADSAGFAIREEPRKFLYGLCERAGGLLDFDDAEGCRRYTVRFASPV